MGVPRVIERDPAEQGAGVAANPLEEFGPRPFSTVAGRAAGSGRKRMDARRYARPFAGVRAGTAPGDVPALCRSYLPKMADHEFFSHVTAAVLHGMWLPGRLERRLVLDVAVIKPRRAPRDARVIGHHLIDRPFLVTEVDGMRAAGVVETFCQLATVLQDDDLVVAAESLLPPRRRRSLVMLDRLVAAASDPNRHGAARLERAAPRLRIGSRSPQETRVRLLILAAGLPEPCLSYLPGDPGLEWTEGDLVYPEEKVWIEVEGDQHRTDRRQWMKDVARYELLSDLGWRVIRVTADDVADPAAMLRRIARALGRAS